MSAKNRAYWNALLLTGYKITETDWVDIVDSFFALLNDLLIYRPTVEPAIAASALELDCNNSGSAMFEPTPDPVAGNFTLSFSSVTGTDLVSMVLKITGTIIITMPANVEVSNPSSIGDWSAKPDLEIAAGTADKIEFQFLRNRTDDEWYLKVAEVAV